MGMGKRPRRTPSSGGDDHWLAQGEEVTALFECALRYVLQRNRTVAERSVLELMRCLDLHSREVGGRVLAHFDSCLAQLERGQFDDAFETLSELQESWAEALATFRRDRNRASHVN
jgi:hypothetical protein